MFFSRLTNPLLGRKFGPVQPPTQSVFGLTQAVAGVLLKHGCLGTEKGCFNMASQETPCNHCGAFKMRENAQFKATGN